jgi:hypothetical protein
MRAAVLPFSIMLLAAAQIAQATDPAPSSSIVDCRSAAAATEQSAGLPSGLLLAIGQVESGRLDPATGRIEPWPWTTNHAGEGHYFASAEDAILWVAAQQAAGNQSIDVGCFQVNLYYHPDAFATLAEAFDPTANALYAAAFLNRLHEQSGSWLAAVALYHSADPVEGRRYSGRVMAAWNPGVNDQRVSSVGLAQSANPSVVRISTTASVVRIVVPDWAAQSSASIRSRVIGLPSVIVPGK